MDYLERLLGFEHALGGTAAGPAVEAASGLWPRLSLMALLLAAAWLARRLSWPMARRIVRLSRFAPRERTHRPERQVTLQGLVADLIGFIVLLVVALVGVVQLLGVDVDTVVWVVGLLSAGFGLAARPIISDLLAGVSFVFEDAFTVGEKVEFGEVEGLVEQVNLRTVHLRSPSGELCIVPNGEIRVMRNFSRGRFSTADVTLSVASEDLERALAELEALAGEVAGQLPDLSEPWRVISKTGQLGSRMELTVLARTAFGSGADLRPRLMARIHERLRMAGVDFES